jgi:hypothetical protein
MTLGRPSFLSVSDDVPLPLPIDDEYWNNATKEAEPPVGRYSINAFSITNTKLSKILNRILNQLYHPPKKARVHATWQHAIVLAIKMTIYVPC